jgi:hypothetical protein
VGTRSGPAFVGFLVIKKKKKKKTKKKQHWIYPSNYQQICNVPPNISIFAMYPQSIVEVAMSPFVTQNNKNTPNKKKY